MVTHALSEIFTRLKEKPNFQRSLSEAAETGTKSAVPYWVNKRGADPNEIDCYGYFPLLNAALAGHIETVKELLNCGCDVNKKGPYGYTALHAAAQNGSREIVELLVGKGADIEARNDDNDTPLILATRAHHLEVVSYLCRSGCNASTKGFQKQSSVDLARAEGMNDVAECLERNYSYKEKEVESKDVADVNNK